MFHQVIVWAVVATFVAVLVAALPPQSEPYPVRSRTVRLTRLEHRGNEAPSQSSTNDRITELASLPSQNPFAVYPQAVQNPEKAARQQSDIQPRGISSTPPTLLDLSQASEQSTVGNNFYQKSPVSNNEVSPVSASQVSSNNNHVDRQITTTINPASDMLEMNLRQAGLDENVYQSPPFAQLGSTGATDLRFIEANQRAVSEQSVSTEQSNNINIGVSAYDTMSHPGQYQHSQQWPAGTVSSQSTGDTPTGIVATNYNGTIELINHVVYEGPATVPPSSGGYYITESPPVSGERPASNAWWVLGLGPDFERASNLSNDDYLEYCANSPLLSGPKQRSLCRLNPKVVAIVARGIRLAIDECQTRFATSRWNCSTALENQLDPSLAYSGHDHLPNAGNVQVFGEVMRQTNRERSFLNAIIGAGLAHAASKACSAGEMPDECGCDRRIKTRNKARVEWVACSDDIDYGARFSREFTDGSDVSDETETAAMLNAHNYEVGRRVFKSSTDITCTCSNGDNGVCLNKRCWRHIGPFSDIGEELMRRYESATHVQLSNRDHSKLRPVRRGVRKPKRKDLVYMHESPDYCIADKRMGVIGTRNRRCNSTSTGPDNCSLICCGRGYQVVLEEIVEDCDCKFVWCCELKCKKCKRQVSSDVCN